MEYNPQCYKPDDVRRFVLERCITAQEGLEMLIDMEDSALIRVELFSVMLVRMARLHSSSYYSGNRYMVQ